MINDSLKPTGELLIVLRGPDGKIKEQKTVPNLIVTTGKNAIASRLAGVTTGVMTHMALGTSAVAADVAQASLGVSEFTGGSNVRAALSVSGGSVSGNQVTFTATFAAGNCTGAVTEAGIFNASTAGIMLARTTFLPVNKDALDTLTISWIVTVS
jgi:hypothetical protein